MGFTLPTAPKPQTSKEVIAANVKLLIEQLEAGQSEGLTAYLTAMGKFHNYSFGKDASVLIVCLTSQVAAPELPVDTSWVLD
jgi:hypothetical protein